MCVGPLKYFTISSKESYKFSICVTVVEIERTHCIFCNNLQWSNHEFEFLVIDTYKTQECVEVIKKLIKVENQDDIDNILMKDSCGQWCG